MSKLILYINGVETAYKSISYDPRVWIVTDPEDGPPHFELQEHKQTEILSIVTE